MGFDIQNFGLGLLTGWATGYGVYRARHRLGRLFRSANQQASSVQDSATQSVDSRYIRAIVRMVERQHLAGKFVPLSDVLIQPRFIPQPALTVPVEDVVHDVFHVVPHVPDFPALQAAYPVPSLTIDDLNTGDRALALLGHPGSGRTTALMAILLRSLGRFHIPQPVDPVQERLRDEESNLNEKQRSARAKERALLEQKANERLAEEQGTAFDSADRKQSGGALLNRLMPVYVHLAQVAVHDAELAKEIDPAEPLIRAVQRQLGLLARAALSVRLYNRLSAGQVLLLIDGFDELSPTQQSRQLAWLTALKVTYPGNFTIVTGPVNGYGTLTQTLGLTPLIMRPWASVDRQLAVERWATAWPRLQGNKRGSSEGLSPDQQEKLFEHSRSVTPFEYTISLYAALASADPDNPETGLKSFIGQHLPGKTTLDASMSALSAMAMVEIEEGVVTPAKLYAMQNPSQTESESPFDELGLGLDDDNKAKSSKKTTTKSQPSYSEQAKLLETYRNSGLIRRTHAQAYAFVHPLLTAYLASLNGDPALLSTFSSSPKGSSIIMMAGFRQPLNEIVRNRMNANMDVGLRPLLEVTRWMPYVGANAAWRNSYLKALGSLFVANAQYPAVRERIAAALVASRDSNAIALFRQSLNNPIAQVRQLACLGLGAMQDSQSVDAITALLKDADPNVQLGATLALGAIRTEAALNGLVEALTEGSEAIRQAAAEMFADIPAEGYPVLYDAIREEDMLVRRAAVFGLKRLKSDWALVAIYRIFLEDKQWYVRSAAQVAFQELRKGVDHGPHGNTPAESITWLNKWAARRGTNVPPGEDALEVLQKALREGETDIRFFAASNLGELGATQMVSYLYGALQDRTDEVRAAAHRSLVDLELLMGKPLPI